MLVDTSVWSFALRRKPKDLSEGQRRHEWELRELIREGRACLIGVVRQEILSGIRDPGVFERVRARLRHFDDVPLLTEDHEQAARLYNRCSMRGIAGTPIDLLICAVADRLTMTVFTADKDFDLLGKHIPLRLHSPREHGA